MAKARVLVITGYGVNSDLETARAAELAGADQVDRIFFGDIATGSADFAAYNLVIFPGGFLDGDDLGAAQAAAMRWRYLKTRSGQPLATLLGDLIDAGGLILGICNGFQLLVKLGILPGFAGLRFSRSVSLAANLSGRYEDRWVRLMPNPDCACVFTKGLSPLYLPVRHGEGRLCADQDTLARIEAENLIALQYADAQGAPTQAYPENPNGSALGIAGLTDPSGRVLGLMPHPEAFHHVTNHPGWRAGELDPPGTLLFVNAVRYLHSL